MGAAPQRTVGPQWQVPARADLGVLFAGVPLGRNVLRPGERLADHSLRSSKGVEAEEEEGRRGRMLCELRGGLEEEVRCDGQAARKAAGVRPPSPPP